MKRTYLNTVINWLSANTSCTSAECSTMAIDLCRKLALTPGEYISTTVHKEHEDKLDEQRATDMEAGH